MRDLPRQLTADQLAELFEGRTRFVERLAEHENPLAVAGDVARMLSEEERLEAVAAHPAIGARTLSPRSAAEQGGEEDPEVLAELAELNRAYEDKFGFRFIVFVNRRPQSTIVPILRERLASTREQELETALGELVAIAQDRWRRH
jgi:2-oxo-4-hydroxy-4-carboxy--5-ureidoimidazoline (OHCU) decarboxylase